jgi:signal transduction histidine kinase/DNA-binding response OmpR family regulator
MRSVEKLLLGGLVLLVALLILSGFLIFRFAAESSADRETLVRSFQIIQTAQRLYAQLQAAETGERGYLLTQKTEYLEPYNRAIINLPGTLQDLTKLLAGDAAEASRLAALTSATHDKLGELARAIEAAHKEGFEAGRQIVLTDIGRALMDDIRQIMTDLVQQERSVSASELQSSRAWERRLLFSAIGASNLIVIAMLAAAILIYRGLGRLRQAEHSLALQAGHLQATLEHMRSGIAVFDKDERLRAWNRRFFKFLALPKELAATGQPLEAFRKIDPGGPEPIFAGWATEAHARPSSEGGLLRRARIGERDLEIYQNAMPDGGLITSIIDITRQMRAEAMLQQSQKMEAVGQLTGGVAHDFNNLLQVITGNLNILTRQLDDNPLAMSRIKSALLGADRGARLTRHLLAFARQQPLDPVPLNLGRLIRGMADLLRRTLGEFIQIETVIAGGLWNTLVDPAQVENAILNLAINARDAMPRGGKLTIEAGNAFLDAAYAAEHAEVKSGQYVMLAITDTGSGMSQEVLARAFEPFFTTKEAGRGTGLGLSMVWGFVKQSGGHLKIYSEVGQGTTIRVYLPREHRPEEQRPIFHAQPTIGGKERILVVEDDEEVRQAVADMLNQIGYQTVTAEDAEAALALLETGVSVDLLFTDVVLPGQISSRELARKAKALLANLRVIYTSGYTENAVIHHGRLDPDVDLLSKPYGIEELARKIRASLDSRAPDTEPQGPAWRPEKLRRALVVEDDPLVCLSTLDQLKTLGLSGDGAQNARRALDLLGAPHGDFDLVITDVVLPDINGYELASKIRQLRPGVKIIVATGYSELPDTAPSEQYVHLAKPYGLDDLRRALELVDT